MNSRRAGNGGSKVAITEAVFFADRFFNEQSFHTMISLERKRTERSGKPFLLMLVDIQEDLPWGANSKTLAQIRSMLCSATRETDVQGWYKNDSVVGIMFTNIDVDDRTTIVRTMFVRISEIMRKGLTAEQFNGIRISFHFFPEEWDHTLSRRPSNPTLYPDLSKRDNARKFFCAAKRMMDVIGSALLLIIAVPLLLLITVAIKLTSKGPVLFSQERVGQYGTPFIFLKFRSMYADNDDSVHKHYVRQLIAGTAERKPANGNGGGVYKLTEDPRVTRVGSFLRKTSLDELPQLFNVLKGDMSLVGPRPPIAYEVGAYQTWHRRRLLEAKPGITGLWQVNGRSRVKFDEMVRLDLQYARSSSLWLDLKILSQTPRAVLAGDGAY